MTVHLDVTTRSWCLETKVSEKVPACILLYSKDETRRAPGKVGNNPPDWKGYAVKHNYVN